MFVVERWLEYSFIHRSIQEYFYSSFISNKSPVAKKIFYNKLMHDSDLYPKLRNIANFLEKSDSYNYNKYFKLPILERYIDVFKISNDSNTLLENFYVSNKFKSTLKFYIVERNISVHNLFYLPDSFRSLHFSIHENMKDKYSNIIFGYSALMAEIEDREEDVVKIKDFNDDVFLKFIERQLLVLGRNLIRSKNEIIKSIDKRDSIEFNL